MASAEKVAVTVLVPTIGRMQYLPDVRQSLAGQTRRDYRVVILDNASPPEARDWLQRWANEDDRVTIARVEDRVPMFANFNRGMLATKTPFVTLFHDDDVYLARYLEVLVGALEAHSEAAFAGSNFDYVDGDGRVIEERRWIERTELWSGKRYVDELIGKSRTASSTPGLVFRRDAFPIGFDETLPIHFGDFVLLMRAAEERGAVMCVEPVVQVRKHAGQASGMRLSASIPLRTDVMLRYLDEYRSRHPGEERRVRSLRRHVHLAHRAWLLWGWVSSADRTERDASLDSMGRRTPDVIVRSLLRGADRLGLHPHPTSRLARVVRSAARALRV